MPIYEYECTKCGHQTEVLQKFSDQPLTKCGLCKGKMRKIVSQSTFHLKGSGWYVTDYASKSNSKRAPSKEKDTPADGKDSAGASKKEASTSSDDNSKSS